MVEVVTPEALYASIAMVESNIKIVYVVSSYTAFSTLSRIYEVLGSQKIKRGVTINDLWHRVDELLPKRCYLVIDEAEKFILRDRKSDDLLYYLSRRS